MVIVSHLILAVERDKTHCILDSCASSGTAKLALISIRIVQRRICIVKHCIVFVVNAYFFFSFFFLEKCLMLSQRLVEYWRIFFFCNEGSTKKKSTKKKKKNGNISLKKSQFIENILYYIILYQERTRNILEILVCSIVLKEDLLCYYYSDMLLYSVWTIFIASKAWLISNHYTTPIFHEQDFRLTAGRAKASSFHVFSSTA